MRSLHFDYIIVGGGTSGLVIAHRLASETTASVLVIEAGRDAKSAPDVLVPGKYIYQLEHDKEGLWELPTEPQTQLEGRSITFLRGKQLGGSSAVNYMAMARGPADDYDEWARKTGDDRWKWQNVLPRMKAMEDFSPEPPKGYHSLADANSDNHGTGGPIKLGFGNEMTPGVTKFVEACQEVGMHICPDINSGNPVGVGLAQFNVKDGVRYYAVNAYLDEEFRARHENLRVQANTVVRRLLLQGEKVVGVVIRECGSDKDNQVFCSKDVILCAGTIASPQLLLSSGIGPKTAIDELDLQLVRNAPGVGNGMLDHSILTLEFRVKDSSVDFSRLFSDKDLLQDAERKYRKNKSGPLSVFGTSGSVAFPKIERLQQSAEFRELDQQTQAFLMHPERPSAEIWLSSGYAAYSGAVKPRQSFITFELLLQNNLSCGTVTMRNTRGAPALEINPKILDHPYDRRIAIETVRAALNISKARAYNAEIEEMVHGPRDDDDGSILDFVRKNLGQGYHGVGTCRMGPEGDQMSVVDTDFNVIGVEGVKIADLSVCPILTCNHTQINAYLIGEQCADVLIQEWQAGNVPRSGGL
ncbi:hypothetical protein H2198_009490 [Neophaeococcomyces mojaviensis]|uniref:Uncharacterized protein n=1 Tax=Neophaeococcomyces mojaviensis TaxID=3383035 RepID=A0ACC2ZUX7_9EURO|nr:hypothetical protein H2198_009490 [Knufia sp. JES_112]